MQALQGRMDRTHTQTIAVPEMREKNMTHDEIIKNKFYLQGADLHEADLHGADLHGADLHGAEVRHDTIKTRS